MEVHNNNGQTFLEAQAIKRANCRRIVITLIDRKLL
jgi:hypothetical protein